MDDEDLPPPRVLPTNKPTIPARPEHRGQRALLIGVTVALVAAAGVGGYLIGRGDDPAAPASADRATTEAPISNEADAAAPATEAPTPTQAPSAEEVIPAATPTPTPSPWPSPSPSASPTPSVVASVGPVPADPDADPGPDPPPDVAEVAALVATGEIPESRGVVKGGRIFLVGTVPSAEDAAAIVALAGEVLGPANVYNGYFIDERASDAARGNVRVDDTVLFETGSAVIAPAFEPLLNQGLALLTLRPEITFTIVGHTDSVGEPDANLRLSEHRAQAVVDWYVERGIDTARLTPEGRGEDDPIAPNDTPAGRELNRRIQVFIENLL